MFSPSPLGKGNCNISSEKHLRNQKTSRGSFLDLELLIFVKKFEFYLMTQLMLYGKRGKHLLIFIQKSLLMLL
jgi:hypothetical protein